MHDIAVLHYIVLAFDGNLARLAAFCFAAQGNIVVVFDNLCTDKATLEVRVDNTRSLRSFHSFLESLRTTFFGTCGEESLEAKQAVGGLDEAVDTTLLQV